MSVTVGQLLSAIQGLEQIGVDTGSAASLNLTNLPADVAVGEDILGVVAVFWPPAAILEAALAIAFALIESGMLDNIRPDPNPITDAQTTPTPHRGRGG